MPSVPAPSVLVSLSFIGHSFLSQLAFFSQLALLFNNSFLFFCNSLLPFALASLLVTRPESFMLHCASHGRLSAFIASLCVPRSSCSSLRNLCSSLPGSASSDGRVFLHEVVGRGKKDTKARPIMGLQFPLENGPLRVAWNPRQQVRLEGSNLALYVTMVGAEFLNAPFFGFSFFSFPLGSYTISEKDHSFLVLHPFVDLYHGRMTGVSHHLLCDVSGKVA